METTTTSTGTRKVFVDLWAEETIRQRKSIVVEIPVDCDSEQITDFDGEVLDQMANSCAVDAVWEAEEVQNFLILDDVDVRTDDDLESVEADLRMIWDEGTLVIVENDE